MSSFIVKGFLIAGLSTSVAACSSVPSPIPVGRDTDAYGNLTVGEKFGIVIGRTADNTEIAIRGFSSGLTATCSADLHAILDCRDGETLLTFQPIAMDKKGHIYLKIEKGQVMQIAWSLTPVAYQDN